MIGHVEYWGCPVFNEESLLKGNPEMAALAGVYRKVGEWDIAEADAWKLVCFTLAEAGGAIVRSSRDNTFPRSAHRVCPEFAGSDDLEQQLVLLLRCIPATPDKMGQVLGNVSLLDRAHWIARLPLRTMISDAYFCSVPTGRRLARALTIDATRSMAAADSTDVPPNFMTIISRAFPPSASAPR